MKITPMGVAYRLIILVVFSHPSYAGSSYVYRRHPLDLNLDDNLISVGGEDYPYRVAVKSAGPDDVVPQDDILKYVQTDITVDTCTPEYRNLPDHTLCLKDSPKVVFSGVTVGDKQLIVDHHNHYRANSYPHAEDMQKVIWDEHLAKVAQKWVKQCIVGHDPGKSRNIPGWGVFTGQNAAGGYKTWAAAVKGWHDEVQEYQFGRDPNDYVTSRDGVGHYIQMIQNTTVRVGCGYAECVDSRYRRYFICNYASGNVGRPAYPYSKGTRCKKCPHHCVDGLCDCKGMFCFNGGRIDVTTCTCTCRSIYKGESCMELNCPQKDKWFCGSKFKPEACAKYGDLKYECPYMCGLCQAVLGVGLRKSARILPILEPIQLFVSDHGCVYTGERRSAEKCYKLGSRGRDRDDCETRGGFYGCSSCSSFAVRDKHCPVMCGVCDPPCDGKQCQNGGTLRPETCECVCLPNFDGEHCENLTCPERDLPGCAQKYELSECTQPLVLSRCPYHCGSCEEVLPCNGKICVNRGKLDEATCNCVCKPQYQGDVCQIFNCPDEDLKRCKRYVKADCDSAVIADMCPYFCKKCDSGYTTPVPTPPFRSNVTVEPGVFISEHGCLYQGHRPSTDICLSYGNNGLDLEFCESQGGVIRCDDCNVSDVRQQCPVMCAVCDPPCFGMKCRNGGQLNTLTCECQCTKRYMGNRCQTVFCPVSDKPLCSEMTQSDCTTIDKLKEDCPYLCGMCDQMSVLQDWNSKEDSSDLPMYISNHGCAFFGARPLAEKCQIKGIRGFDKAFCESEGGNVGCSKCGDWTAINNCPVMCGACDPPCGKKTCQNGGVLRIDGSCECKCPMHYEGDTCETLTCPAKEKKICAEKVADDCTEEPDLWKSCPFLCGLCQLPTTPPPPPTTPAPLFVSEHGCRFEGNRASKAACIRKGLRGFDTEECQTNGGSLTCEDCVKEVNTCPVMCGICDPPCGTKTCLNGGIMKVDGSCKCKCPKFYEGDICETLLCPERDPHSCRFASAEDCVNNGPQCPYLCGLCIAPTTTTVEPTTLPVFKSEHGCQFEGKRITKSVCESKGRRGHDDFRCETQGGKIGCSHCHKPKFMYACPVMCGLCDNPCGEKRCLNDGKMSQDGSCTCKCSRLFTGDVCETVICPKKDKGICSDHKVDDCRQSADIRLSCPYLCGICKLPPTTPPPSFTSEYGCIHIGDRPFPSKCKKLGKNGLDTAICASEGGDSGCDDCVTIGESCPVMCGLCDAPCAGMRCLNEGKLNPFKCACLCPANFKGDRCELDICGSKTCQNGGVLKVDGSCQCKCQSLYEGETCQTLVCPSKDKSKCSSKTEDDCQQEPNLWTDCPILCGICEPPMFTSEFGCTHIGERPAPHKCKKFGKNGLDTAICASEGGDSGCNDCVTVGESCPVMCGLCDAPCSGMRCENGGKLNTFKCVCVCSANFKGDRCQIDICGSKRCENGGVLKEDGSCQCKCPPLYEGETCQTLMCPSKDKSKCSSKTEDDCQQEPNLWTECPILCGICEPPMYVSEFGCTYIGERPSSSKCKKLGTNGLDNDFCASENGNSGCDDCVSVGESCPVMCGLCDAPCQGKRCVNGGKLNPFKCRCWCPSNFKGDRCEIDICGSTRCENGGVLKEDGSCQCKCPPLYEGETCQTLMCPSKDKSKCSSKTEDDCQQEPNLWTDCPILCGICEPPKFVSEFGCTYTGKRPTSLKCTKLGRLGLDLPECSTEGGNFGCDDCVTVGESCPVMCGLCDAPCNGKRCVNSGKLNPFKCTCLCPANFKGNRCETDICGSKRCENGGVLKEDGSCQCKCPPLYEGETCQTLNCPSKDKSKCSSKTEDDCQQEPNLWTDCPILCGICEPPKFESEFGCTYIGERPGSSKCKKLGKNGLDTAVCTSEGGDFGCDDCVTVGESCPVMCGLCDAPCGGKRCLNGGKLNPYKCVCLCPGNFEGDKCETNICGSKRCQNGGVLKEDGSCQCKCPPLYEGETCQTLMCPSKDKSKCSSKTEDDCQQEPNLWTDCPILCGICEPPKFVSEFGCTYIGERPSSFKCTKLGSLGLDQPTCASEGGDSECDDCVTVGESCPVMCGLCDAPCNGKRCTNGGRLNPFKCVCVCSANFEGDRCETNICGNKVCQNGGVLKVDGSCQCKCPPLYEGETCEKLMCPSKDKAKCSSKTEDDCQQEPNLWMDCPILCGICEPPPLPTFHSKFGCTFVGKRPAANKCKKLGRKGLDAVTCVSEGGDYGCDDCVTAGESCPVMCGLCDAPCGGMRCLNGGVLNPSKCKCKCLQIYEGDRCEKVSCPGKDIKKCGKDPYFQTRCKSDVKVISKCPYMCGVC